MRWNCVVTELTQRSWLRPTRIASSQPARHVNLHFPSARLRASEVLSCLLHGVVWSRPGAFRSFPPTAYDLSPAVDWPSDGRVSSFKSILFTLRSRSCMAPSFHLPRSQTSQKSL